MSKSTRRWRGAVLALAVMAAFAGGLLALEPSAQLADFSWSAPASAEGQ
ncbi:hypothetical protein [Salinispora cortesiana]|nr:hypothetical protein [Salinispora cortesiana]